MWFIFALVFLPILEIALFIRMGDWIGLWPTLGLVVAAGVVGLSIMRRQGVNALNDLRRASETLDDPTIPVAHGALVMLAGLLLFIPGFFTDILGLLLLVPPLRDLLLRAAGRRVTVRSWRAGPLGDPRASGRHPREPHRPDIVIDGDYEEIDRPEPPPRGGSGWTQH